MNRGESFTHSQLDTALKNAKVLQFDPQTHRYIIFSDIHKADKARSIDDFSRNEMVLAFTLRKYFDNDFRLVLNGDIEECWEAKPRAIINAYRDSIFALERMFVERGYEYYTRIYGNHDEIWANPEKVKKHLWEVLGSIRVYPALRLGTEIMIAHGHQGDTAGDSYSWISRHLVRHGWRWLQRMTRLTTSRAAKNSFLRRKRDQYLYRWAKSRKQLLIAGHTHRPMFRAYSCFDQFRENLESIHQNYPNGDIPFWIEANLEKLREIMNESKGIKRWNKLTVEDVALPCYFNSGACVHKDGITGIELADGEIRLVKWALSDKIESTSLNLNIFEPLFNVERTVLQRANLNDVLNKISGREKKKIIKRAPVFSLEKDAAA